MATIPEVDVLWVKKLYPEIWSDEATQEDQTKALVRFSNDPRMAEFMIRRA